MATGLNPMDKGRVEARLRKVNRAAGKGREPRIIGVDINLAGAWRSLGTFDLDKADIDAVLDAAEALVFNQACGQTGKLRVTDASDSMKHVLMYWDVSSGWREAGHAR